jgi:hypothetical protein
MFTKEEMLVLVGTTLVFAGNDLNAFAVIKSEKKTTVRIEIFDFI